ncbi:hypothetical protein B0H17DRAFT_1161363 [Mycena rosella]|uniref:Uncharacterized protein n=1 Tax=Mycena rosella TaxID=1033263 RepID=A0AAD7G8P9_MYCRO|nr:hypothetical protein B0H17DRAFT_1161363 [Mycena rosella]
MYAPKLYQYYCWVLKRLFQHHPDLVHNFDNSIFPTVTFNCGPNAITFSHLDHLNLSHGFCGITCGGTFDHTLGGHIHMEQLKLYIQFPSAASMLIPSGCLHHGNTPIQRGETRHSITQYAAGGSSDGSPLKAEFDGTPGSRWEWALGLFSKHDELEVDRAAAFDK